MNIDWAIQSHSQLPSTQDVLKEEAVKGAAEGLVIRADSQSNGHGRHGRNWISPPGNLYCSLLLRPACEARLIGQISLLTGLAVIRTAQKLIDNPAQLQLKWPNDVLLEGLKCAGILLETGLNAGSGRVEWVALGIGVNLLTAPPEIGADLGTDLKPEAVLELLLQELAPLYGQWKSQGFAEIKQDWLALSHTQGVPLCIKIGQNQQNGTFHDLDEFGNLILSCGQNTLKTITAGDVYINNDGAA